MFNYFKAISLAMGVLADLGTAMAPDSEEGSSLSQREIVRLAVKTVLRVAQAFGAQISNADLTDDQFMAMVEEELRNVLMGA